MSNVICLVTDAWAPQVNGVVTTLTHLKQQLELRGFEVNVIESSAYSCYSFPFYKEVKMPWNMYRVYRDLEIAICTADYVHIATEGPIGLLARIYCHRHGVKYTTSYHTRFPEYVTARASWIPLSVGYKVMRWMHNRAESVLVTTESMKSELAEWGIKNMVVWSRGVDTNLFVPNEELHTEPEPPILGYVGRVSVEKNMEAFLDLPDSLGTKVVVGDGPDFEKLKKKYPNVQWLGYKFGEELVAEYNKMHVMVFPSKTDTFGLVNIEAMACGTPVAAFPVTGPKDIIKEGQTGSMNDDLEIAVRNALKVDRTQCAIMTKHTYSWDAVMNSCLKVLVPAWD